LQSQAAIPHSVHLTGGILRHFQAFSTPWLNPAPKPNPSPARQQVTQTVRLPNDSHFLDAATLTSHYTPNTYPVTPYVGDDGRTLDASTGLTYPTKAERARRNPKVALLYSDPVGSGLIKPAAALVLGLASVREEYHKIQTGIAQ